MEPCKVLVIGAHPDDAEVFAGGLVVRHCQQHSVVRIVSVTDGRSGHHEIPPEALVPIRREEARQAGESVGAEYLTWDFPDGTLQPTLEVRSAIIREIRTFAPDLVMTHRPNDYHPDHRAVGTAVQDASYLVTVPHVCPETPALRSDPVVGFMCDLFTRPNRLRADAILDVAAELDGLTSMAACHKSQFFEWLAYHDGELDSLPESDADRWTWLANHFRRLYSQRLQHFQPELQAQGISWTDSQLLEVYEISEYATRLSPQQRQRLFPGALS